jgi:hypothetical protein
VPDEDPDQVVPIDPGVRSVLSEFSRDPIALADEVVKLRAELANLRIQTRQPPAGILLKQPEPPPDAPAPTRLD